VIFPLTAIVGSEALVEALLINAVAPEVGGVLVRGERGTAKSTAVRALAPLLPPVRAAVAEPFAFAPGERAPGGVVPADAAVAERPAPLVELPLGATLDRLVGALDLGRALAGDHAFEPGLLARAHRGILYVDEVNLLPDHLVDALLDAAASGVARVERDAVSVEHDARFLLVGTMNVEEGELRPQLLDRFGLGVEVRGPADPSLRAEIVRRRLAFEEDPAGFGARFGDAERTLAARIAAARERLGCVRLPERELMRITGACARLGVDGVRGDIVCARAAQALAALDGDDAVGEEHVRRAAALALAHRRRRDPLESRGAHEEDLERALDGDPDDDPPPNGHPSGNGRRAARPPAPARDAPPHGDASRAPARDAPPHGDASPTRGHADGSRGERADGPGAAPPAESRGERPDGPGAAPPERRDPPAPARLRPEALRLSGPGHGPHGRRAAAAGLGAGAIDSRPAAPDSTDLAVVATIRARLTGQAAPGLREHIRAGREGALLCLVVDASGSMGARKRLARVKGALLAVIRDAYARRDRVAVVAFRDGGAHLLVTPGAPLERAAEAVRQLPAGGRTPLAAGLDAAERLLRRERVRDPRRRALAIVLTDGRVADPRGEARAAAARLGRAAAAVHVVDTEDGPVRLGLAAALASAAGGQLHPLVPLRSAA
jgi:magnesium chelatase subunit D